MSVCIAIMFVTVIAAAVGYSLAGGLSRGLFVPSVPDFTGRARGPLRSSAESAAR